MRSQTRHRLLSAWVGVFTLSSCGLAHTVDRDLLRHVSLSNKLLLFDAENNLSIAIDEKDKIDKQILEVRRDIRAAYSQRDAAREDEDRADDRGDAEAVRLAIMAQDVAEMKIDYLRGYVDFLDEKRDVQERHILLAQAQFELAKAKLIKENNVKGAEKVDLEDFENQVKKWVEVAKDAQADLAETSKELDAERQAWLGQREKLRELSGGGLGSPWADDATVWGAE
ncbi:MAG: hypothetical protein R3C68_18075 [Myxococcota bacterium]